MPHRTRGADSGHQGGQRGPTGSAEGRTREGWRTNRMEKCKELGNECSALCMSLQLYV